VWSLTKWQSLKVIIVFLIEKPIGGKITELQYTLFQTSEGLGSTGASHMNMVFLVLTLSFYIPYLDIQTQIKINKKCSR
jgi:hypothetical protein